MAEQMANLEKTENISRDISNEFTFSTSITWGNMKEICGNGKVVTMTLRFDTPTSGLDVTLVDIPDKYLPIISSFQAAPMLKTWTGEVVGIALVDTQNKKLYCAGQAGSSYPANTNVLINVVYIAK
jgi:hypothetical protein